MDDRIVFPQRSQYANNSCVWKAASLWRGNRNASYHCSHRRFTVRVCSRSRDAFRTGATLETEGLPLRTYERLRFDGPSRTERPSPDFLRKYEEETAPTMTNTLSGRRRVHRRSTSIDDDRIRMKCNQLRQDGLMSNGCIGLDRSVEIEIAAAASHGSATTYTM